MEQYWRSYNRTGDGSLRAMDIYYIERDDAFISISANESQISKYRHVSLHDVFDPQHTVLREVPKELVIQALKKALESLNLPGEINYLKHKL